MNYTKGGKYLGNPPYRHKALKTLEDQYGDFNGCSRAVKAQRDTWVELTQVLRDEYDEMLVAEGKTDETGDDWMKLLGDPLKVCEEWEDTRRTIKPTWAADITSMFEQFYDAISELFRKVSEHEKTMVHKTTTHKQQPH